MCNNIQFTTQIEMKIMKGKNANLIILRSLFRNIVTQFARGRKIILFEEL